MVHVGARCISYPERPVPMGRHQPTITHPQTTSAVIFPQVFRYFQRCPAFQTCCVVSHPKKRWILCIRIVIFLLASLYSDLNGEYNPRKISQHIRKYISEPSNKSPATPMRRTLAEWCQNQLKGSSFLKYQPPLQFTPTSGSSAERSKC